MCFFAKLSRSSKNVLCLLDTLPPTLADFHNVVLALSKRLVDRVQYLASVTLILAQQAVIAPP